MKRRYGTSPTGDQPTARISSSDMAASSANRSAVTARNASTTSGPDSDRIDSTQRSLPSPAGFLTCSPDTSTSGAEWPWSIRSVPTMWARLS